MSIDVQGKSILISGAASGIGRACAETLAQAGGKIMVADIASDAGQNVVHAIQKMGGIADFRELDVTSEASWASAISDTIEMFGSFDVLVNNAGIFLSRMILDTSLDDWRKIMTVNLEGTFIGVKEAIRTMQPGGRAGQGGAIVNIASTASIRASASHSAYCASKAGVHSLTKVAALECAQFGKNIRVNSVHPAVIDTPMSKEAMKVWADHFSEGNVKEMEEMMGVWHPLGRMGTPEEVANAVLYLASDAATFCTGVEIRVDGGFCLGSG